MSIHIFRMSDGDKGVATCPVQQRSNVGLKHVLAGKAIWLYFKTA